MNKLRIGVLMGGRSLENEVSLNSGRTVCDHLDSSRYTIIPIFQTQTGILYLLPWHFLHRGKIADFVNRLSHEAQRITWDDLKLHIDFMYIAQHGRYAEDGRLQGMLEMLGIPYFGSKIFGSALGMDKAMQRTFLKHAGIEVAESIILRPHEVADYTGNELEFPCVVKPSHEGSSLGVTIVKNRESLATALIKARDVTPDTPQPVIIEKYITGMEFSCIVITDKTTKQPRALPPSEIVIAGHAEFFDYDQKYMPGQAGKITPARCSAADIANIQATAIKTMQALEFSNIARIDGFLTSEGTVIIIDPNSFCGMDPATFAFLQAAHVNMSNTDLINHLIETDLETYGLIQSTGGSIMQATTTKKKVGVLFGGRSLEREISLASGRNIVYKLSPQKYEAIPLFVSSELKLFRIDQRLLVCNKTEEIEAGVTAEMHIEWNALTELIDFAFIALHGGEGENGALQGMLETLNIAYNGSSVLTSALCMNKFKTNLFLASHAIAVPQSVLVNCDTWSADKAHLGLTNFPYIVKPHDDGCSFFVQKVTSPAELDNALTRITTAGKTTAMVEEYIEGIELTVGVIGNSKPCALPPSMALSVAGILSIEEKFLPGAGENQTPAPLEPAATQLVKETVQEAYSLVGCKGYARIDCFYQSATTSPTGSPRVVILEINTLPGLTPATCIFHQAAEVGLKPMDFVDLIVELGLEEHSPQRNHAVEESAIARIHNAPQHRL